MEKDETITTIQLVHHKQKGMMWEGALPTTTVGNTR
jgi:hypothetical protein